MDIKQKHQWYNAKFFKRWAPVYDYLEIFIAHLRKKAANKIKRKHAKILDMACGTGSQSIAFAKKGFSVVGIDLSEDMLKHAQNKRAPESGVKFLHGDATEIAYDDNTFDASSISFALHDMPEEIGIMALKEMIRTTKKDGQILIIDYDTPQNWLGAQIVKMFESKYYAHFMKITLDHYLKKVRLSPLNKETYFFGNFQIVECINTKMKYAKKYSRPG